MADGTIEKPTGEPVGFHLTGGVDAAVVTVRRAVEADAEHWLAVGHQLDHETKFMMLEPGERTQTVEQLRDAFRTSLETNNGVYLLAEVDGKIVGVMGAHRGAYRRNRHGAHIWVGILDAYTGQGIGRRLFEGVEAWAREQGLHRLDLTVLAHNARGIALYTKMGFEMEGRLRHSFRIDGEWIDELQMGKLLA